MATGDERIYDELTQTLRPAVYIPRRTCTACVAGIRTRRWRVRRRPMPSAWSWWAPRRRRRSTSTGALERRQGGAVRGSGLKRSLRSRSSLAVSKYVLPSAPRALGRALRAKVWSISGSFFTRRCGARAPLELPTCPAWTQWCSRCRRRTRELSCMHFRVPGGSRAALLHAG